MIVEEEKQKSLLKPSELDLSPMGGGVKKPPLTPNLDSSMEVGGTLMVSTPWSSNLGVEPPLLNLDPCTTTSTMMEHRWKE